LLGVNDINLYGSVPFCPLFVCLLTSHMPSQVPWIWHCLTNSLSIDGLLVFLLLLYHISGNFCTSPNSLCTFQSFHQLMLHVLTKRTSKQYCRKEKYYNVLQIEINTSRLVLYAWFDQSCIIKWHELVFSKCVTWSKLYFKLLSVRSVDIFLIAHFLKYFDTYLLNCCMFFLFLFSAMHHQMMLWFCFQIYKINCISKSVVWDKERE